jgi:hypothetical protein
LANPNFFIKENILKDVLKQIILLEAKLMTEFMMNDGLWLKGSLHCHSTLSDGLLMPEDVARFYEERDYMLLSITDHNKICKVKDFKGVYIYGIEVSKGKCKLGESYHIVALGFDDPAVLNISDAQSTIDYINGSGGLAFIAHPYWSNLVYEDLSTLTGYVGIEIYNTGCDVEVAKGYSLIHWDCLLSSGRKMLGLAVDDAHRYFKPPIDANGGWIWVNVNDVSAEGALKAIRDGRFYSSMSPKILLFNYTLNSLSIDSTPVNRVNLITLNGRGLSVTLDTITRLLDFWMHPEKRKICEDTVADIDFSNEGNRQKVYIETKKNEKILIELNNKGIVKTEVKKEFKYPYLRVEIVDSEGKCAWINPICP